LLLFPLLYIKLSEMNRIKGCNLYSKCATYDTLGNEQKIVHKLDAFETMLLLFRMFEVHLLLIYSV
jgi:hypothetical protein